MPGTGTVEYDSYVTFWYHQLHMKLLLTSGGLSNESIIKALFELTKKKASSLSVAFIPTASNVETGDKGWLIKDLVQLQALGFQAISIVDISAVSEEVWRPQLEAADEIFAEGGNTFHLMRWIKRSGLAKLLPEFLKTKVYIGASAGSMIFSKDLVLRLSQELYGEDMNEQKDIKALGLVDFYFLPHLNSKHNKNLRTDTIQKCAQEMKIKIYALDDQSALKVTDDKVEIISEGKYLKLGENLF